MRDCSKIPKYSGEHLSCEVQNLQIQEAYSNGFAVGGFFFFILGLLIMWLYCWADKKEKGIKEKNEKIKAMGKPIIETLW